LLAEKKSLKRFLLVYVVSTMLLVGMGEWFYYKAKIHSIIDSQVSEIISELKVFMAKNKGMLRSLRFKENYTLQGDMKIAVYKDGKYMFGNFKPEKIYFSKEFWKDGENIYYLYTMPKRWGKIDVLVTKPIDYEQIKNLKTELLVFNFFVIVFVIGIAVVLGKIFLKPLKNSIEVLEDFIRDATHEMNTPISVILTNIEMLRYQNFEKKEFERIEFAVKRLEKIFKDLTFVRLNHKRKQNIQNVNLKDVLKTRLGIFSTIIEKKNLHIEKECDDVIIKTDYEDAVRLMDNLLSNAVKYSPQNGKIRIELKKDGLKIANKGKINNLKKITSKFYRESKNEGGFGLGLYIVKKICGSYGFEFIIKNSSGDVESIIRF
jgi:two-component system OmpR family sensor kinase